MLGGFLKQILVVALRSPFVKLFFPMKEEERCRRVEFCVLKLGDYKRQFSRDGLIQIGIFV